MSNPARFPSWITCTVALACSAALMGVARAQDEGLGPLFQQSPFDRIILKSNQSVDVQKIRFADGGREVPSPLPTAGKLTVRPLDAKNATLTYDVSWTDIARIDLFEDLVLQEAKKLTAAGDFDEAYGYYEYLLNKAGKTRGLDAGVNRYLQTNAHAAFMAGEFDRALAILGSLYERAPKAANLGGAVDTVAERIIRQYLQDRNFKSARLTLDVVDETFRGLPLSVVKTWREKFEQAARQQLAEAQRLTDAHEYLAARQAVLQAVGVWPETAGAQELQARIQREHPVVRVGVLEQSPRQPVWRLDSWASSRAATLVSPTLVELRDYSTEGGVYESSVAEIEMDDSGMGLTIHLAEPPAGDWLSVGLGASAFARRLLAAADPSSPEFDQMLADLMQAVNVVYPQDIRVKLNWPHVRPEALLTLPMPAELTKISDRGLFEVADYNDALVRFAGAGGQRGAIAEVHETSLASDDDAVSALIRGDVDLIDRLPPWQLSRLRAASGIKVDSYRLPTIHALIPTGRSPLTGQREFRRALCYGIDRKNIVSNLMLGGDQVAGFEVVSGPFPAGVSNSDPIRYGYNGQIEPREYNPYMAIVLASAAWTNAQKMAGIEEPAEELPTLTLGHTSDPLARTSCLEIAKYLGAIGIPIELVEFSPEQLLAADDLVDLKYVELSTWEPVVDARRLLGSDGLLGGTSDFMSVALDRLDGARNWNEVRARLFDIHDTASFDLPVIPLWQTINYFAYRDTLTGISPQPVRLYQDIGNWQITFSSERL